jgi:hypothetical protein
MVFPLLFPNGELGWNLHQQKVRAKRQFQSDELFTQNSKKTYYYANVAINVKSDLGVI